MRIEEAILENRFRSESQKAGINIIYTANWLQNCMQEFLNTYHITPQQYNVLRILKSFYPLSLSTCDIRRRMLDKMSDVSRIVDRLARQGLIVRKVSLSDKRLIDIYLSDEGVALLNKIDKEQNRLEQIMSALSKEELEIINSLLDKLRMLNPDFYPYKVTDVQK
ncbi:MAG: MarR family transcriptional regulator [Bacteroidia bacterium]|nr:MarR family transcriptional regulator [Bacteroidia bacterium]MDW8346647.1 MarR family transcriptional regulator [Bacteroidia bacterium]